MARTGEDDGRSADDVDPASAALHLSDALYRFYDHAGDLLYVGITGDGKSRFGAHRRSKPWWDEVTRIEIERHPNRDTARSAEVRAIREEKPRYNIADVQAEGPELDAATAAVDAPRGRGGSTSSRGLARPVDWPAESHSSHHYERQEPQVTTVNVERSDWTAARKLAEHYADEPQRVRALFTAAERDGRARQADRLRMALDVIEHRREDTFVCGGSCATCRDDDGDPVAWPCAVARAYGTK